MSLRFRLSGRSRDEVAARQPLLAGAAERVVFVAGPLPDVVLRLADAAAMTLGRHVLVRRRVLREGPALPGWLAVHELAHVEQYARAGAAAFLARYVADYVRGLRGLGARARGAAYRGIAAERAAAEAEAGFEASTFGLDPL